MRHDYRETTTTKFGGFAEMEGESLTSTSGTGSMTLADWTSSSSRHVVHTVYVASRHQEDLETIAAMMGHELCRRLVFEWAAGDTMRDEALERMTVAMMP